MSHHDDNHNHAVSHVDPDPKDSRADAVAAVLAVLIAVAGILFFISQHGA